MPDLSWSLLVFADDGSPEGELRLRPPSMTLGRENDNDLVIDHASISSTHARLTRDDEGVWWIEDLGSTNGTWVKGQELKGLHALVPNEELEIGLVKVKVREEEVRSAECGVRSEEEEPKVTQAFLPVEEPKVTQASLPVEEPKVTQAFLPVEEPGPVAPRQKNKSPKPPKSPKSPKIPKPPKSPQTGMSVSLWKRILDLLRRPSDYGSTFFALCTLVHSFLARWIPFVLSWILRTQEKLPLSLRMGIGFLLLALTLAWMGWARLPGHFLRMGYSAEMLEILEKGGIVDLAKRFAGLAQLGSLFCLVAAALSFLRRRPVHLVHKAAVAAYLLVWLNIQNLYTRAPAFLNDGDYKLFSNAARNEYWIRAWFPWSFALIVPALLALALALRRVRAHYCGERPSAPLTGDRIVENLRRGGRDPRMRSSSYWSTFFFAFALALPFLMGQCGWEADYGLVKGSGNPVVEMVKVKKKKEKPKKRLIVNNWSPYIFERMKIDDIKVLDQIAESSMDTYEVTQQQAGKLGKGGGKTGGWPKGMEGATVRFIRLKYDGGDWDQDMGRGADFNLLLRFNEITGFPIAKETESREAGRLRLFAKGKQPPFVYLTGKGDIRFSSADINTLRWYTLEQGGMLFIDNGGPGRFDRNVRNLLGQIFPGQRLIDIPNDDPIFQAPFVFPSGAPPLWKHAGDRALGIRHNGRWVVFYHPGDMADAWRDGHSGAAPEIAEQACRLGINVMYYAFNMYYARHYE
jgi:pSer/pThr/pTyr-binding forkhead associated (FHA) protein